MKYLHVIILTLFKIFCNAQDYPDFNITDSIVYINFDSLKLSVNQPDSIFYEDNLYKVRKTCAGEWGGSIWFKSKKSGIEYSCTATCPVMINKINGKYFVTNSLAHLFGSSYVIQINDPRSMDIFNRPKCRKKKNRTKTYFIGDLQSKSTKGTINLADSIGILILTSFVYKDELYHIHTDFNQTVVSKIESGKFVTIKKVSDESIWTYSPLIHMTEQGHILVFFDYNSTKGYIEIFQDNIIVNRN